MDERMRRRDRRHIVAICALVTVGLLLLALGALEIHFGGLGGERGTLRDGPLGLIIPGLIAVGLAIAELVHRLVRGPQPPGRHQRGEDR